jgi:hypothetical protein
MTPRKAAEQLRMLNDENGLLSESADMLDLLIEMSHLLTAMPKLQEGYGVAEWQNDRIRLLSKVLEHSKNNNKQ